MSQKSGISPPGRVSFPSVYEPNGLPGSRPKFNVTLIFRPNEMSPEEKVLFDKMVAAAQAHAVEKFRVKIGQEYQGRPLMGPFHKGTEKPKYYDPDDVYIKFVSTRAPNVVDEAVQPITQSSGGFYAGCIARVTWELFEYDKGANRGVGFGLRNVQKVGIGEHFGGEVTSAEDDFEPVATSAEDDFSATGAPSNVSAEEIPF